MRIECNHVQNKKGERYFLWFSTGDEVAWFSLKEDFNKSGAKEDFDSFVIEVVGELELKKPTIQKRKKKCNKF